MKKLLFTIVLTLSTNLYSQQFSFQQLTEMIMSQSLFERKNIAAGNDVIRSKSTIYYSYETNSSRGFMEGLPKLEAGDEFTYLVKEVYKTSEFGEEYSRSTEAAWTFYQLKIIGDFENIILGDIPPKKEERFIEVIYNRDSDYQDIAKVINQYCNYIGIDKYNTINYTYGKFHVELDKYDDFGVLKISLSENK